MKVLAAARRAFDTVPIYRRLYGDRPARTRAVPAIGPSAFHLADSVADCIVDADAVVAAVAPLCRGLPRLPFSPVEDRAEAQAREQRLLAALDFLGCTTSRTRFLLLADDATGPLAARLSNSLAAAGGSASILFHAADPAVTGSAVAALDPHSLILLADDPRLDDLAVAGCAVLRLVGLDGWRRTDRRGARLLFSDELHAIGAARAGDPFTLLAQGGLVFETTDPGGQLLVTTVAFTCLPLIRYALGRTGDDLLQDGP